MAASTPNSGTPGRAGGAYRPTRRRAALALVFCLLGTVRSDAATEGSVGSAIAAAASKGATAGKSKAAKPASPLTPVQRGAPAKPGAEGQSHIAQPGSGAAVGTVAPPASVALYHFKPSLPTEGSGELYISDSAARFSDSHGLMRLERGPTLTSIQGDWLSGMTAFRVVNWDAFRATNPSGPCWTNPVRWIAVRRSPKKVGEAAGGPLFAGDIDVAVLSEPDIRLYRQDSPTLCSVSTYRLADAAVARSPAAKTTARKAVRKKAAVRKGTARKKATKAAKATKRKSRRGR